MGQITLFHNVRARQDPFIFQHTIDASGAAQFLTDTSVLLHRKQEQYIPYTFEWATIRAHNHNGTISTTNKNIYRLEDVGDHIHSLYYRMTGPALIPNTSPAQKEAYYCQSAPFASIDSLTWVVGSSDNYVFSAELLYENYARYHPWSMLDNDTNTHRFANKSLLQQASTNDVTWFMPIILPWSIPTRLEDSLPVYHFAKQQIEFHIKHKALTNWVVGSVAPTAATGYFVKSATLPFKFGGSVVVAESDFGAQMIVEVLHLDEAEIQTLSGVQGYFRAYNLIMNMFTYNMPTSVNVGTPTFFDLKLNHPHRAIELACRPKNYTDGTTEPDAGVGLLNWFCYIPNSGEFLNRINIRINNEYIYDTDLTPVHWRSLNVITTTGHANMTGKYLIPFQHKLNTDKNVHTVNFTRLDRTELVIEKNQNVDLDILVFSHLIKPIVTKELAGAILFGTN